MRLTRLAHSRALAFDAGHQLVPRFDEGSGALVLQPRGERIDVDTRLDEACQNGLAIATVSRQRLADLAVLGESLERAFRHGVDGERRGQGLHIENVGGFRVLGAGAGPEEPLTPRARLNG